MEDRGVRRRLQKLTREERDSVSSANLDRGQRLERPEHERIREFIHELYEELLSLAEAARSILHWPLANEIAPENPTTSEDKARETGLDKTLADSFPSSDPSSTIPDPPEPGVQRKKPDAS
jgi:NADH pyrophosphatase NudC (nudix superfamily)